MDQIVHFIASHWQLVVALLVIVLLIIMNEVLTQKKQGKTISAQEVVDLMNHQNAVVVMDILLILFMHQTLILNNNAWININKNQLLLFVSRELGQQNYLKN